MQKNELFLSFSGGGFRAALYCLGGYRRLVELYSGTRCQDNFFMNFKG